MTKKIKDGFYWVQDELNSYRLILITVDEKLGMRQAKCVKTDRTGYVMDAENLLGPIEKPLVAQSLVYNKRKIKKEDFQSYLFRLIETFPSKSEVSKQIIEMSYLNGDSDKDIATKLSVSQSAISRLISRFKKHSLCKHCHQSLPADYSTVKQGYFWLADKKYDIEPVYIYEKNNSLYVKKFTLSNIGDLPFENVTGEIISPIHAPLQKEERKTRKGLVRAFNRITRGGKRPHRNTCKAVIESLFGKLTINQSAKKYDVSSSSVARFKKKIDGDFCYSCGQLVKEKEKKQ